MQSGGSVGWAISHGETLVPVTLRVAHQEMHAHGRKVSVGTTRQLRHEEKYNNNNSVGEWVVCVVARGACTAPVVQAVPNLPYLFCISFDLERLKADRRSPAVAIGPRQPLAVYQPATGREAGRISSLSVGPRIPKSVSVLAGWSQRAQETPPKFIVPGIRKHAKLDVTTNENTFSVRVGSVQHNAWDMNNRMLQQTHFQHAWAVCNRTAVRLVFRSAVSGAVVIKARVQRR